MHSVHCAELERSCLDGQADRLLASARRLPALRKERPPVMQHVMAVAAVALA